MPSSHNCFSIVRILFTHPEQFMSLFSLILRRPSFQKIYSFSTFNSRSPNLTGASFKYSLISSGSLRSLVSKFSQASSFFSNSSRWIVPLLISFSILTVVRSRVRFLRYHIDSFVLSNPTGGSLKTFPSLRNIYLNPFYKNKNYIMDLAYYLFSWRGLR